jgi:hypothetical protein
VPQGWTKAYEFSFGDLRAGVNVLEVRAVPSVPQLRRVRAPTPPVVFCRPYCTKSAT